MTSVKVFTTPVCPYCKMVKQFLKKNQIEFTEVDIRDNVEACEEMIEKSGQRGVPVIRVGDEVIIGFDEERLKKILQAQNFN